GPRDSGERPETPRPGKVCGDRILHTMYGRMNVIAPFQPGGELWVRTTTAQIDDQIARDRDCAGLPGGLMHQVQHKVDACSNAGTRVSFTIFNIKTILENSSSRGHHTELIVTQVVRGAGVSVKKTGTSSDEGASTDRDQLVAGTNGRFQPCH